MFLAGVPADVSHQPESWRSSELVTKKRHERQVLPATRPRSGQLTAVSDTDRVALWQTTQLGRQSLSLTGGAPLHEVVERVGRRCLPAATAR